MELAFNLGRTYDKHEVFEVNPKDRELLAVQYAKRRIFEGSTVKDAVRQAQVVYGLTAAAARRLKKSLENYR